MIPIGLLTGQLAHQLEKKVERQSNSERRRVQLLNKQLAKFANDIGPQHREARVNNYQVYDERQNELVRVAFEIGNHIESKARAGKGLFLFGGTGTGKDHICVALMIHATSRMLTCRWVDCQGILYPSVLRGESIEGELYTPDIVCLSDPVLEGTTDANRKCLFRIANRRWSAGKSTWVTCNLPADRRGAERLFGDRTLSRLLDRAAQVHCPWDDWRGFDGNPPIGNDNRE